MVINYPFAVVATVYAGSFGYLYRRCRDHLPFHKYLSNHTLWLAPLNFLFTFFTVGRQTPIFDTKCAAGLDKLKENYPLIRSEAKALLDAGVFATVAGKSCWREAAPCLYAETILGRGQGRAS